MTGSGSASRVRWAGPPGREPSFSSNTEGNSDLISSDLTVQTH